MLALTLSAGNAELRHDYPAPTPVTGEALLRVRLAGICGTDLAMLAGYKSGFTGVLGHEYVAEVVTAPGCEEWEGRRVVGEISTTCGHCTRCRRGLITHCATRRVLGMHGWDGVFAAFFTSPISNLHPVPPELPDETAVFSEPVAAALAAVRDIPPAAGDKVIVFGDGRMGLLIAQVLVAAGYDPLIVGRHPAKLAVARQLGLRTTESAPQAEEFDIAVDATANPQALPAILASLRPRGALILKSTTPAGAAIDLSPVVVNELRVIGSRCGSLASALAALAAGVVQTQPLVTARYPLIQALEAIEYAGQPGVLKVLLEP